MQDNSPIKVPILKDKVKLFATGLGITNFEASECWLDKFKKRHDLTFKKVCGKNASVDPCIILLDWINVLTSLIMRLGIF